MSKLAIKNLNFTYDGDHTPVFEGLDLQLDTNWKLGLVGRNGRGKTTLLHLLDETLEGTGSISMSEPCRYYPPEVTDQTRPVLEILTDLAPYAQEWELQRELSLLGLEEEVLERPFSTLSGGEQTRALLAGLFIDDWSYPMLDEPTNHLDAQGREQVARYLREKNRGFLLVSHDRNFLDLCTDHTLSLNPTGPEIIAGNFSVWYQEKQTRDQSELVRNERLKGEISRLKTAAARTENWSDQVEKSKVATRNSGLRPDRGFIGHKSAKMMKRSKAIQSRQEGAIQQTQSLLLDVEQADSLKLTPLKHHSTRLLELQDVTIQFGEKIVCQDISFTLNQGDRLCLEGGNGSGKTSLLRLALGELEPQKGTLWRASGLIISHVSQKADHLTGGLIPWSERQGIDLTQFFTILRKLNFSRELFERDMREYSAGQKKKVMLACSLCQSAHLYVWDEPLNYIDLLSRIQIEELLLEYQPTLLFVEHDQVFRDKIATRNVGLCPNPHAF